MSKEQLYQLEYKKTLETIYKTKAAFDDLFGELQVEANMNDTDKMFTVKTSNIATAVVIGEYDTELDLDTTSESRFGPTGEIVYGNTQVPFDKPFGAKNLVDKHTVNANADAAVADVVEAHALKLVDRLNARQAAYLKEKAGKTFNLAGLTSADIDALFDELDEHYNDLGVDGEAVLKVSPVVYNAIMKHPMATTGKGSTVNIDKGQILEFRGFYISKAPKSKTLFKDGVNGYAYVANMGVAFTGISETDVVSAKPQASGYFILTSGKTGQYIPEANLEALVKITLASTPAVPEVPEG